MKTALLFGLDPEAKGREIWKWTEIENPLYEYQRDRGCSYEEAIALAGYTLSSKYIANDFYTCMIYVPEKNDSSKDGGSFCRYIEISANESGRHSERTGIYVRDWPSWIEITSPHRLANLGSVRWHAIDRSDD